jgi:hypothetical protein
MIAKRGAAKSIGSIAAVTWCPTTSHARPRRFPGAGAVVHLLGGFRAQPRLFISAPGLMRF